MKVIGNYKNGDYFVTILEDGTKIRHNDLPYFTPEAPESMDLKITNQCDMMCPFCHEKSTPTGVHGDILGMPFIDTLLPYTEIAIGGGNPLSHPDLIPFLWELKDKKIIANMTVNQVHFGRNFELIKELCENKLIHGIGVSLTAATPDFIEKVETLPNAVIHVIYGVTPMREIEELYGRGLKILVLGYKDFGRGEAFIRENDLREEFKKMYDGLDTMMKNFKVLSFDNLAIRQLEVGRLMSQEEWDTFYMGDDGQFTMYVDAVNKEFAVSSTSKERWPVIGDIQSMFKKVRTTHERV